jgi:hypothetical protein
MIKNKKQLCYFLLLVMAFSSIIQFAEATTMNFTVHGDEEIVQSLDLAVEDRVLISFTVVGPSENTLYFSMTFPDGTVVDFGKIGSLHYPFTCNLQGKYVLHFSNAGSSEDKLVTLEYEAQHYIFGMPQMLFLTIIIVVVCLVAVAAFVFMGKPH